jgi:predicted ATPase
MRIITFSATRYRSLRSVEGWEPGVLNVLIGPNGSGKSNVLRAIDLLSVSAQGRLAKSVQFAGGIEPLLWDGQENDLGLSVKCSPTEQDRDPARESLSYEFRLARLGRGSDFEIGSEQLANFYRVSQNPSERPFKFLERNGVRVRIFDDDERGLVQPEEEIPPQETMLSLAKGPFNQNRILSQFRAQLAGFSVYHDFHTHRDAIIRQPTVTRHETRVDADGQNLVSVLHTLYTGDRDFKNEVNDAMTAAFGSDFEELVFPPAADQRIQLRLRWRSLRREQSAADLSDGTLRFLFLLTVLASPDPAPVIAIDEPETGLHPSMLPIVAEYAVQASRKAQVILTTHSPQFLDAFSDTRPRTTVVQRRDGETHLHALDEDQLGRWLESYTLGALHRSGELEEMAS